MKIAVYTVALNEEQFVKRWYESAKDADYLLIADTGSTDKTKEIASELGIEVHSISVAPWRFDDARNSALSLIPSDIDYCISLDMDEVLSEGWREELEKLPSSVTRPIHRLVTSFDKDGNPGVEFDALRILIEKNIDIVIKAKGFTNKNWITQFSPGDNHSEVSWSKRLPTAIQFLFRK